MGQKNVERTVYWVLRLTTCPTISARNGATNLPDEMHKNLPLL